MKKRTRRTTRKSAIKPKRAGYIHGYDPVEQQRLVDQANYLERWVYTGIDFHEARYILEVGCGVGAQTKILLRRFPQLKIDAVDLSAEQLAAAAIYLADEIREGRVELIQADGSQLRKQLKARFGQRRYDGAFLCWFLEHVPGASEVLAETRPLLKRGAKVFVSEVANQTFFVDPPSPTLLEYWRHFNEQQIAMSGDPNVGLKLGNLLKDAGFREIRTEPRALHFDARDPKLRREFAEYFEELVLSGAPALIKSKRVSPASVEKLKREFRALRETKEAILFLGFMRAEARA